MTMTTTELQEIYDRLGCKGTAAHLGRSRNTIGQYLRAHGVIVRPCGRAPGKIERNRVRNQQNGDSAYRSAPVKRTPCPHGVRCLGAVKPCVMPNDGHCDACRAEHTIAAFTGSCASSSFEAELRGAGR